MNTSKWLGQKKSVHHLQQDDDLIRVVVVGRCESKIWQKKNRSWFFWLYVDNKKQQNALSVSGVTYHFLNGLTSTLIIHERCVVVSQKCVLSSHFDIIWVGKEKQCQLRQISTNKKKKKSNFFMLQKFHSIATTNIKHTMLGLKSTHGEQMCMQSCIQFIPVMVCTLMMLIREKKKKVHHSMCSPAKKYIFVFYK